MLMTAHHALGITSACVLSANQYKVLTSGLSTLNYCYFVANVYIHLFSNRTFLMVEALKRLPRFRVNCQHLFIWV